MKKLITFIIVLIAIFFNANVFAYDLAKDSYIYVGGQAIGIRLDANVSVIGTYGIYLDNQIYKPWENIIYENDIILSYDDYEITSVKDLLEAIKKASGKTSKIRLLRDNVEIIKDITPISDGNSYSLGLYIKDSVLGVGTLTYYIKEAGIYGSLGHKITSSNLNSGDIYEAKVDAVILPTRNQAGQKKATIIGNSIGNIDINSNTGIQGYSNDNFDVSNMEYLKFKTKDEINLGEAEIWTVVEGVEIEKFEIEILRLEEQDESDIKGINFIVKDKDLINRCGGIVQGMSGSPIVQDNKLIGAVTHVSVKDPINAYGIYIEWMFQDMGINVVK